MYIRNRQASLPGSARLTTSAADQTGPCTPQHMHGGRRPLSTQVSEEKQGLLGTLLGHSSGQRQRPCSSQTRRPESRHPRRPTWATTISTWKRKRTNLTTEPLHQLVDRPYSRLPHQRRLRGRRSLPSLPYIRERSAPLLGPPSRTTQPRGRCFNVRRTHVRGPVPAPRCRSSTPLLPPSNSKRRSPACSRSPCRRSCCADLGDSCAVRPAAGGPAAARDGADEPRRRLRSGTVGPPKRSHSDDIGQRHRPSLGHVAGRAPTEIQCTAGSAPIAATMGKDDDDELAFGRDDNEHA